MNELTKEKIEHVKTIMNEIAFLEEYAHGEIRPKAICKTTTTTGQIILPKKVVEHIGVKIWDGVIIEYNRDMIIIKKAYCPKCDSEMYGMKGGGIACPNHDEIYK